MAKIDVQKLNEVLRRMREEDPDFKVFGSEVHKYRLGPPLSEEELLAFEQKYQIRLPTEYRFFLKEAGDGGANRPVPKTRSRSNAGAGPDYGLLPLDEALNECDPSMPFPFSQPSDGQSAQGDEKWGEEIPYPGLLGISHRGCTYMWYLVVNGPAYGTVWSTDWDDNLFDPTGLSFAAWYQESGVDIWFGDRGIKQGKPYSILSPEE
ncbi:MAG: SMI1/KNR4 family protein [Chthonomonadales bacterium]